MDILDHPLKSKAVFLPFLRVLPEARAEVMRTLMPMRMLSALAWCVFLLFVYALLRLFLNAWISSGVVLAAAMQPYMVLHSGFASNDLPAAAWAAAAFYLLARLFVAFKANGECRLPRGIALWSGITLGCAILTKTTALGLVPVFVLAWAWMLWQRPSKGILTASVLGLAPVALIAGWWFVRNGMLYGDVLGFEPLKLHWRVRGETSSLDELWGTLLAVWHVPLVHARAGFDGLFGPHRLAIRGEGVWGVYLVSIAWGSVILVLAHARGVRSQLGNRALGVMLGASLLTLVLLTLAWWKFNSVFWAPQPRYWFTGLPALLLLAGVGTDRLPRMVQTALGIVPVVSVATAAWFLYSGVT